MIKVLCPKCGNGTDRLYELPYGSEEKGWMCDDCVFERCNVAHLWAWTDEDFERTGVKKVELG